MQINYNEELKSFQIDNKLFTKQQLIAYINADMLYNALKNESVYVETNMQEKCTSINDKDSVYHYNKYRKYICAIKSKPFLILAGISGTGKSRIVRELARSCWEKNDPEFDAQKPRNFEMIQVKPNWHDSSDLIGYISRIGADKDGNGVTYVIGDFLRFIVKAWEEPNIPYFLCLDEMNLAPVEQYFAEYLSVIESRKSKKGEVITDPIIKKSGEDWFRVLTAILTENENLRLQFLTEGISIPKNLIVIGTVNMDETTFSFSRKVLDRAMTIEMNEVSLLGGLDQCYEKIRKIEATELIGLSVEGVDVYSSNKTICDKVINYLIAVNSVLENTPFKIAYRTRNEFLLYVINNLPYVLDENDNKLDENFVVAQALDEITSMKILPRIEGDETKVSDSFLQQLSYTIGNQLNNISSKPINSISLNKIKEMSEKLKSGYTSFWS